MSYHNTNISTPPQQSITNSQGQTAPAGYHYMPDGSLMSDVEHARLYNKKIINSINLDLADIRTQINDLLVKLRTHGLIAT